MCQITKVIWHNGEECRGLESSIITKVNDIQLCFSPWNVGLKVNTITTMLSFMIVHLLCISLSIFGF